MKRRDIVIQKLLEFEDDSRHHFYFTGKSIPALEAYALNLISEIEKSSKLCFKGIVKHFSIVMPYFDDIQGADKFLRDIKESVSIAKDCYDEYTGFILIECDKEWANRGMNEFITHVLEYIKSLTQVRYVVLLPYADKREVDLYAALSTVGVWAFVEIEEIDYRSYIEEWNVMISEAGFSISDTVQDELCKLFEKRKNEIFDIRQIISQWLSQLHLNRQIAENYNKEISSDDIRLLSGVTFKRENHSIGFGTRTGR